MKWGFVLCVLAIESAHGQKVDEWLQSINPVLAQYADALEEYGYSNADMLLQQDTADLEDDFNAMKIKKPHRRLLMKACSADDAPAASQKSSSTKAASRKTDEQVLYTPNGLTDKKEIDQWYKKYLADHPKDKALCTAVERIQLRKVLAQVRVGPSTQIDSDLYTY
jgi:hypothetical protein